MSCSSSVPFVQVQIPLDSVLPQMDLCSPSAQPIRTILAAIRQELASKTDSIRIEVFTNGITNKIFCMSIGATDKLVFRVYGANTEQLVSRECELANLQRLNRFQLGAPLFGRFSNGYVCGFLPGDCLDVASVRKPEMVDKICQTLVRMHKIPLFEAEKAVEQKPVFEAKAGDWLQKLPAEFESESAQRDFDGYFGGVDLAAQFARLSGALQRAHSPLVFSHNDLLIFNSGPFPNPTVLRISAVLFDRSAGRVHFIDYEYAGPNHQLFDIGNHLCEYAGVEDCPDYERNGPTEAERRHFLGRYFAHFDGQPLTEQRVAELARSTRQFEAASHFFWTLWAIHQARLSTIDFDYMRYAICRHQQYARIASEFGI